MSPWSDDDAPGPHRKRPSNWGCAIAAIVGSIALIVVVVLALGIANGLAGGVLNDLR
jgi:hypothetical protein